MADAEGIVQAMEEAGVDVIGHGTTPDGGLLMIKALGDMTAWTRFRGVPLAEVERELEALYPPDYNTNAHFRSGYAAGLEAAGRVLRRLRGGDGS